VKGVGRSLSASSHAKVESTGKLTRACCATCLRQYLANKGHDTQSESGPLGLKPYIFEHHKDSIRWHYRCFDRILLNGLIQPFQQPERVVGFFKRIDKSIR
jgi:hypothetical protein